MVDPSAAARPPAPAQRDDSAAALPACQGPQPPRPAKSTSPADSDTRELLEVAYPGLARRTPRTSLPSASSKSPPSCHFPRWSRSAASPDTTSSMTSHEWSRPFHRFLRWLLEY